MFRVRSTTIKKVYVNFLSTSFIAEQSFAAHYSRSLVTNKVTSPTDVEAVQVQRYQKVVVMRHGDRLDNFDSSWLHKAPRPWDPPLTTNGRTRARIAGVNIRTQLGLPIRIFVSPFLRCLETANEVIYGLCGIEDRNNLVTTIDSFKAKVSIEYGLCEIANNVAIRHPPTKPENAGWGFKREEAEMLFPHNVIDPNAHRVFDTVPRWGENSDEAAVRFKRVIDELADKYPLENLLLISHGIAVKVAAKTNYLNPAEKNRSNFCRYAQIRRPIFKNNKIAIGKFELETVVDGPEIPYQ